MCPETVQQYFVPSASESSTENLVTNGPVALGLYKIVILCVSKNDLDLLYSQIYMYVLRQLC